MKNEWSIEEFKATLIEEKIKNNTFVVPKYQRGIVWSDKQKLDLVDTIKKGLPFGTLLLYKTDDGKYQIIDGLQRSSAISEFVKNPTNFFNEDDIDVESIKEIVRLINVCGNKSQQEDNVKELLIDWVKNDHKSISDVVSMQFSNFGRVIADNFPTCKGKEFDIADIIMPMMKNYQEICSVINSTKIPAIVISGDNEMLPLIFERINSKGLQLSKYQVYAATWSSKKYRIDDKFDAIVKANKNRYDVMLEGNGIIDDYDSVEFMQTKKLDTFEIAFGLGKYLSNTYPHLFVESKEDKKVDSVGFTLIGTCLGLKYTEANIMHKKLDELIGESKINDFLEKIIDSVKYVERRIGKFGNFKSNSRNNKKSPLHSELQIVAIISSVFLMKWANIELDEKDDVKSISYNFDSINKDWKCKYEKNFKQNISKRYLTEIFKKKWSGTGNTKLDQILSNPTFYTEPVTTKDFEASLDGWFKSVNEERMERSKVASPKEQDLAFLSALYLPLFTANQQSDESNYDIEHLATQKLMKNRLSDFDENLRLPISSIGNMCLLPEYTNRSKKDRTLYEDTSYLDKSKISLSEIEETYSFTSKEDLEWIHDKTLTAEEFKENYTNFIEKRFNRMKKIILDNFDSL